MLAKGYHLAPVIDHDTHNTVFGRSHASRTVVLATDLTQENIMDGYRFMRFYASKDRNVNVHFTINGAPMGSMIEDVGEIEIEISIEDVNAADKTKSIKILTGKPGSNVLPTIFKSISNKETFHFTGSAPHSAYYFLEITQKDGDKMYTAPIWVRR